MVKTADRTRMDEKFYAEWDSKMEPMEVSAKAKNMCSVLFVLVTLEAIAVWIFNVGNIIKSYPYADIITFAVFAVNVLLCGYTVHSLMKDWSDI